MLDLDARVHLDEVELAVAGEQELHRADVGIADDLRRAHRRLAHLVAQPRGQHRARRLLDHLLMAALDRAIALAQMDHVATRCRRESEIRRDARARDISPDTSCASRTRPRSRRAPAGTGGRSSFSSRTTRIPLPPPPAAALISTGKPSRFGIGQRLAHLGDALALAAGQHRHAGANHDAARARLVTHQADMARARADEVAARTAAGLGEVAVFGKEAIAGMDRVGAVGRSPR